jgi:sphingolipid delta-4 desaturase
MSTALVQRQTERTAFKSMINLHDTPIQGEKFVDCDNELLDRDDFFWDTADEPHLRRKYEILKAHPEIKELFGCDPNTKYKLFAFVAIQLTTCYFVAHYVNSYFWFFIIAYIIGGTFNHSCSISIHEATHNLIFEKPLYNTLIALFVNLPLGVPAAMAFKRYHHEHHQYQGVDVIDTDIGTKMEADYLRHPILKLFNVIFLSAFYAIRPLIVNPKTPTAWELANTALVLSFDYLIYNIWGGKALFYLIFSTFLGLGLHPCSGHFIQEHFVFKEGQETYSYYGPLNYVMLNVGYHVEHHDFPRIPGSRLPLLRKIAPEFYDNQHSYTSWVKVIYDYIFTVGITPYNRVKRKKQDHDIARRGRIKKGQREHDCVGNAGDGNTTLVANEKRE